MNREAFGKNLQAIFSERCVLRGRERLVLAALLAEFVDRGPCPSVARLCERTGFSSQTVHRALGELRDAGAIDWQGRWVDGSRTSNRYVFLRVPVEETLDVAFAAIVGDF